MNIPDADASQRCPHCGEFMNDVRFIQFHGAWGLWKCPKCERDVQVRHNGYPAVLNMWTTHVLAGRLWP